MVVGRLVLFVGCWPQFAACRLLCMWLSIGRLSSVGRPGLFVGDVEGTLGVVDAGDLGL